MSPLTSTASVPKAFANEQLLAWMARIGYAARGVVFLIIGGFALLAALGAAARPQGMRGALQSLLGNAGGGVLLWIVAVDWLVLPVGGCCRPFSTPISSAPASTD